ncbi:hypothetical protein D3C76_1413710 [compost metagenome]
MEAFAGRTGCPSCHAAFAPFRCRTGLSDSRSRSPGLLLPALQPDVGQLHRFGRHQILRHPHPLGQRGGAAAQGVAAGIVQPGVIPGQLLAQGVLHHADLLEQRTPLGPGEAPQASDDIACTHLVLRLQLIIIR